MTTTPDRQIDSTLPGWRVTRHVQLSLVAVFAAHFGCGASSSTPSVAGGTGGSGTGGAVSSTGGATGSGGGVVGTGGTGANPGTGGSGGLTGTGGGAQTGSGGAASGGAAGAGGGAALGCAGKTYKLCEDFENGALAAVPPGWTKFKGYGAGAATDVGLATDAFRSGKMAVKSSSMATGQGRIQKSLAGLGATASKHWGRIFYKVQSPATRPASGVLHVTFVGLFGTGENRVVDIVEATNGTHQWLYNNPNDSGGTSSPYNWTFDAVWHCAEWYVDVSTKSYRFFSDSKEVTQIAFTNKQDSQMTPYNSVIVGSTFYQTPPAPFVMWFDDLAIDDNQIGCQ